MTKTHCPWSVEVVREESLKAFTDDALRFRDTRGRLCDSIPVNTWAVALVPIPECDGPAYEDGDGGPISGCGELMKLMDFEKQPCGPLCCRRYTSRYMSPSRSRSRSPARTTAAATDAGAA